MEQKALLRVVVVFLLGLSYVAFAAAVPATRSLKSRKVDASVQDLLVKEDLDLKTIEEVLEFGTQDRIVEGRMMIMNIADYPRTGPNPAHTPPKSPGKV